MRIIRWRDVVKAKMYKVHFIQLKERQFTVNFTDRLNQAYKAYCSLQFVTEVQENRILKTQRPYFVPWDDEEGLDHFDIIYLNEERPFDIFIFKRKNG